MNISRHSFVTPNEILADVLPLVGDVNFITSSKGFYISQIQQALEELAFETFFDNRQETFDIPDNLRIELPKGAFNIENIYLVETSEDGCNITKSANVFWKKNFINSRSGNGYVSMNKGNNGNDPLYKDTFATTEPNGVFYYAVQQGVIMLSSSCRSWSKILVEYSGTGGDIGDEPFVPIYFRQAVKGYVAVKGLEIKVSKAMPSEKPQLMAIANQQRAILTEPYSGTWVTAERRARRADDKEKKAIKEYMQRMYY